MNKEDIKLLRSIYGILCDEHAYDGNAVHMEKFKSIIDGIEEAHKLKRYESAQKRYNPDPRVNFGIPEKSQKRYRLEISEELLRWINPGLAERNGEIDDMWDESLLRLGLLVEVIECNKCGKELDGIDINNPLTCEDCQKVEPVDPEEWACHMLEWEKSTQTYKELIENKYSVKGLIESRIGLIVKRVAKDSLKQGEANNQLKHRETETFEDWATRTRRMHHPNRHDFTTGDLEEAWKAHAKSRGH